MAQSSSLRMLCSFASLRECLPEQLIQTHQGGFVALGDQCIGFAGVGAAVGGQLGLDDEIRVAGLNAGGIVEGNVDAAGEHVDQIFRRLKATVGAEVDANGQFSAKVCER